MITNRIQEVLHVRRADLVLTGLNLFLALFQKLRVRALDVASRYLDPAFVANELETLPVRLLLVERLLCHHYAVGIFHGVMLGAVVSLRNEFHRA